MKSMTITPIHLGRYKIEIVNDNGEYACVDGGSAYVMMFLSQHIFMPEHAQYVKNQRESSNILSEEQVKRIRNER